MRESALQQRRLPVLLRFYVLVPLTILFIAVTGLTFTLPPGPLCDDGMILFMEGGCDWGDSNIFFFSKLGGLVALNFAFVFAIRRSNLPFMPFAPHILLLCWLSFSQRSGGPCDTYYSHPNGSIGQMAVELTAFALLGLALLRWVPGHRTLGVIPLLLAWNGAYIAAFYFWLLVAHHWTWWHTFLVSTTLLVTATVPYLTSRLQPFSALSPNPTAPADGCATAEQQSR